MDSLNRELHPPKNGTCHKLLGVCRIGTVHQDRMSLDDQFEFYREWAERAYPDGFELEKLASQGSGEILDREKYLELCHAIESGEYDCVVAEDLGRMVRRVHALILCEAGEDSDTRIVAINDHVDTFDENYMQAAIFATLRHSSSNKDTSLRIRRSLRGRFKPGDLPLRLIAGYEASSRSAVEKSVRKAPTAIPVVKAMFERLDSGQSLEDIAAWLNDVRFPVGPYVRKKQIWDGTLVGQYVRNPLLKGLRRQNQRMSKRVNKSGRRITVVAPETLNLEREVPHLAFVTSELYDRVIAKLQRQNVRYRRGISKAADPRNGKRRRVTRWPAQHARCGICGRNYVLGGHGQKDRMMCDGARRYQCWNAMSIDRVSFAEAVASRVRLAVENIPEFDSTWVEQLRTEADIQSRVSDQELKRLSTERDKQQQRADNLGDEIAAGRASETVRRKLQAAEEAVIELNLSIARLESRADRKITIPSADQVRELAKSAFVSLATESREFGDIMRVLLDDLYVLPYRLFDGGHIQPRCVFTLNLASLPGVEIPNDVSSLQFTELVSLTHLPQRAEFREAVIQLRKAGYGFDAISKQLKITDTAAKNAAAFAKAIHDRGLSDPWMPVRTAAEARDYFPRIRNSRFVFTPADGFTPRFPES
jgi:site-specific DNA recombinase